MKIRRLRLIVYICSFLSILMIVGGVSLLYKSNVEDIEQNVLTTDDVDKLLKEDILYRKDYFNVNKQYDNVEVAASDNFSINVSGDLVTFYLPNNGGFYYNKQKSYNSAKNITAGGGAKNGNYGYLSLPNDTYYFYSYNLNDMALLPKGPVTITNSCKNDTKFDQNGTFTVERCYIKYANNTVSPAATGTIGSCVSGYKMSDTKITSNGCNISVSNGLQYRYCKVMIQSTCVKDSSGGSGGSGGGSTGGGSTGGGGSGGGGGSTTSVTPKLTSVNLSSGTLSPAFNSSTYNYSATVPSTTSSITITGTVGTGTSFVSGFGNQTVDLNYGNNVVKMKVTNASGSKTITYVFNITRTDDRSIVNTLSNLTVSSGTLSPSFYSSVNEYEVEVDNNVDKITIDATLTDVKSSFVPDNGPGTYDLIEGPNKIYLKITSQSGATNIYTITVTRKTVPTECTTNYDDYALLKKIEFSVDINGLEVDQIEDFDPKVFHYTGIKLNYKVTNVTVNAFAQDDADAENIEIEGADDLIVNDKRLITIKIKSAKCSNVTHEYTVEVTRQPEVTKSENAELDNIEIDGYDIGFSKEKDSYGIKLKKGDDKLKINLTPTEETTTCTVEGNEDLRVGSQITIRCVAEDPDSSELYTISIDGVEKGTNVFLIIIVVIGIIVFLVYLLLKLLGYKVVLNVGVIGAFFRGMGEKIKNIFDK